MQPFVHRRERLAQQIRERGGGVAVLFTAPEALRNRDSEYPYRWDSYFYYLTGFPEPQAVLVMSVTGEKTETQLFCREKNPEREIWDGYRFGPQAAARHFGFDGAHPFAELDEKMPGLLADQPTVFFMLGSEPELDARMQRWLGAVRAQARTGVSAPSQAVDIRALLDEMRLLKDAHETSVMRRAAIDLRRAPTCARCAHARPGMREYEIEAELLHEFRRNGSQFPAYGSIVAGGAQRLRAALSRERAMNCATATCC